MNDITIQIGDEFNPLEGVYAKDKDGNLLVPEEQALFDEIKNEKALK